MVVVVFLCGAGCVCGTCCCTCGTWCFMLIVAVHKGRSFSNRYTSFIFERQGSKLHMVKKEEGKKKQQLTGPEPATSRSIADPLAAFIGITMVRRPSALTRSNRNLRFIIS